MSRVNKFQEGHGAPKASYAVPDKKRKRRVKVKKTAKKGRG